MDQWLTLMQIAALAVTGMSHALLGSIKVPLARKLQIDETRVGGLVSVFGFTLIPMVIVAGFLVDSVGKQLVLGGGFVLLMLSLVILSTVKTYRQAFLAVLVLGTGWSALVNVLNVTSPPAFVPAEELPQRMAYAMNMGDFIFGMGAFIMPILVTVLMRRIGFKAALLSIATLGIIPLLLGLGVNWDALVPATTETVADGLKILLANPIVWICCAAFFCHVPVEAAVATWATTLMTDKGVSEGRAAGLLSVFWLSFMGSRLVVALALLGSFSLLGFKRTWDIPESTDAVLVLAMAGCCVLVTLGIVRSRTANTMCVMVVLAGLILGPIFPTLIAILLKNVDASLHGRAVGIFFCIGGIGWTVIPMMIGAYAQRTTVQRGFVIATVSAMLLTLFSTVLWFQLQKLRDQKEPGNQPASVSSRGALHHSSSSSLAGSCPDPSGMRLSSENDWNTLSTFSHCVVGTVGRGA